MDQQLPPEQTPNGATAGSGSKRPCRRRWRKGLLVVLCLFLAASTGGELYCRFVLGLGDPPLSMVDAKMRYCFKPNQTCIRFGHLVHYNAYSMRTEDFPAKKTDPSELRVMIVGDSVTNGGVLIDQSETFPALVQKRLAKDLGRKVLVMNASAGGWGPPSELAYVETFGFFDADMVVWELASHDYADAPLLQPVVDVNVNFPGHKPLLALEDGFFRYFVPRMQSRGWWPSDDAPPLPRAFPDAVHESDVQWCRACEHQFYHLAKQQTRNVFLFQYYERAEMTGPPLPGYAANLAVAREESVPAVNVGPVFVDSVKRGQDPYRDGDPIHANVMGNQMMADTLAPVLEDALKQQEPGTR
jgi:hypothetical protein